MSAYIGIYERYADDAAFLWHLRSLVVDQPHYTFRDLIGLDQRIQAHLDGLMTAPADAWKICGQAMSIQEPGEVFTAAVLAFRSLDVGKIQAVVESGLGCSTASRGLISALGWLPGWLCHSWIKKFLTSKDLDHKFLAIAACSIRREDPEHYLTSILQRPDCIAHTRLYARGLRLVGELKRNDLMPLLRIAMRDERPEVVFWSCWSAALLGDSSAARMLQPFVEATGPLRDKAVEVCFRSLPIEEGRQWISRLARSPDAIRTVITATANLGDPQAVPWLIAQMKVPTMSRIAGEAFTTVSGITLAANGLALDKLPDLDDAFPNDDPHDERVGLDEDEHLEFPDPYKVAAIWERYQDRFTPGQRYFLGKPVSPEHLSTVYSSGNQRQRRMAAIQLALSDPDRILANYRAGRPE